MRPAKTAPDVQMTDKTQGAVASTDELGPQIEGAMLEFATQCVDGNFVDRAFAAEALRASIRGYAAGAVAQAVAAERELECGGRYPSLRSLVNAVAGEDDGA